MKNPMLYFVVLMVLVPGAVLAQTETPQPSAADLIEQALTATAQANPAFETRITLHAPDAQTAFTARRIARILDARLETLVGDGSQVDATLTETDGVFVTVLLPKVEDVDSVLAVLTASASLEVWPLTNQGNSPDLIGQPFVPSPFGSTADPIITAANVREVTSERDADTGDLVVTLELGGGLNAVDTVFVNILLGLYTTPPAVVVDGTIVGFLENTFDEDDSLFGFIIPAGNPDLELLALSAIGGPLPSSLAVENIESLR